MKRQPLRAWVAKRLKLGTNLSGVDGESAERIQITKRDQSRSQPTATLRGSVDINASGAFAFLGRICVERPNPRELYIPSERGKTAELER